MELYFPGLLTLRFPRGLKNGIPAALTMEWWGEILRYQVDRKMTVLDRNSAIKSLELTGAPPKSLSMRSPFLISTANIL